MKDKEESLLEQLPTELLRHIAATGLTDDSKSKCALASTSKRLNTIVTGNSLALNHLFYHIKQANKKEIEALLQEDIKLLLEPGNFQFDEKTYLEYISAFELAIDMHKPRTSIKSICEVMLDCIGNDEIGDEIKTQLLLICVARGEQDLAEKILRNNPKLLLNRGNVTDCSGRYFKNITAFELMLWALDTRYMWKMMYLCIIESDLGNEDKLEIIQNLLVQYEHVHENRVTYLLDGNVYKESYYDISPLLTSLKEFIDNYNFWFSRTAEYRDMAKNHWGKNVGGAQLLLPANFKQHYCEPNVRFTPCNGFKRDTFFRYGEVIYPYDYRRKIKWFSRNKNEKIRLGVKFAIWKGDGDKDCRPVIHKANVCGADLGAERDYCSMRMLHRTRLTDLSSIKNQLSAQVQLLKSAGQAEITI